MWSRQLLILNESKLYDRDQERAKESRWKSTAEHNIGDQEDFAQSNMLSSLFREEMKEVKVLLGCKK